MPSASQQIQGLSPDDQKLLASKTMRMSKFYSIKNRDFQIVPYRRNQAQLHYAQNKSWFNIILKSRRVGFTTEISLDMLDDTLFGIPYKFANGDVKRSQIDSLIIAHTKEDAAKIFDDKISVAWDHFPLKFLYNVDTDKATMLKFGWGTDEKNTAEKFSSISVSNSGRSGGFFDVLISEYGKICAMFPDKAKEIIRGTIPAVPDGGRVTIESTAEGKTGSFHDIFWDSWNWQLAHPDQKQHNRQYKAHFYNWRWDVQEISKNKILIPLSHMPTYFSDYQKEHKLTDQEVTYLFKKWEGLGKDFEALRQEYPTTPKEAFEASTNLFFDPSALQLQEQFKREFKTQGAWRIYEERKPNHIYAIGADPSEGLGLDNAAAGIWDFSYLRPKLVAVFENDHTDPDMFAYELKAAGLNYNTALICVERNNHGHTTLIKLREIYPEQQIYCEVRLGSLEEKETDKFGWPQNVSTKSKMCFDFKTALNEMAVEIPDEVCLNQLSTYEKTDVGKIKKEKDQKYHWDLPIAVMLGYQMKDYVSPVTKVKTYIAQNAPTVYNRSGRVSDPYSGI